MVKIDWAQIREPGSVRTGLETLTGLTESDLLSPWLLYTNRKLDHQDPGGHEMSGRKNWMKT